MGYNDPSKPSEGSMAYPSAPPPAYQPYEVNGINELITRVFELIPVENIEIKNSLENKLYFKFL